jgi:phosphatidylglycerol:prolipoprotein diacylglycerol transferase
MDVYLGVNLIAILVYVLFSYFLTQKLFINKLDFYFFISLNFIFGFIGSKIFYLFEADTFELTYLRLLNGYVLFGGIISMYITTFIYSKVNKFNFFKLFDLLSIANCISFAIGKLSCFYTGCCYGQLTNSTLFYTEPTYVCHYFGIDDAKLIPIQLYDSVFLFLLFLFLIKKLFSPHKPGLIFLYFGFSYSIYRFISEIYRGDLERGIIPYSSFSFSQIYSFLFFLSILSIAIYRHKRP